MTTRRIIIPELEAAPPARQYWTQEEKAILASYYGNRDTASIARYLGKSINSVQGLARMLGLSFTCTDEEREDIIRKIEAGEL